MVYDTVSICFTKVVDFATRCAEINVQQTVELLNQMYTLYDALTEQHKVYKVETIGDSYMLVSGAPHHTPLHAAHITEMALQILDATRENLHWPPKADDVNEGENHPHSVEPLQLFIGCNSGPIVAGIVGYKTPRYCLFGDTVNAASRMMSNGLPDKIHISQSFADALSPYPYIIKHRGKMNIKGKGEMDTFIVHGRTPEFTATDGLTGLQRDFVDILKEDFDRHDEAKFGQSLTEGTVSIELTDTASEYDNSTTESLDEDPQQVGAFFSLSTAEEGSQTKLTKSLRPPDLAELVHGRVHAKATTAVTRGIARRGLYPINSSEKGERGSLQRLDLVNRNPETENVLRQAAVRLASKEIVDEQPQEYICQQQESCRSRVVRQPKQEDVVSTAGDLVTHQCVTDSSDEGITRADTLRGEILGEESEHTSQRNAIIEPTIGDTTTSYEENADRDEFNSIRAEEEQFMTMIERKVFGPMPTIPLTSPCADILLQIAEPLSLCLTELLIVRPRDPIAFIAQRLRVYATTNSELCRKRQL